LDYLLQVAEENPAIYHKLAIAPEQAFIMGILAGAATKTVVLGRIPQSIEIDLFNWEAHNADQQMNQALHAIFSPSPTAYPAR
jgi:hypothetical protein